jgi:hypothetical protein
MKLKIAAFNKTVCFVPFSITVFNYTHPDWEEEWYVYRVFGVRMAIVCAAIKPLK